MQHGLKPQDMSACEPADFTCVGELQFFDSFSMDDPDLQLSLLVCILDETNKHTIALRRRRMGGRGWTGFHQTANP